MASVYLKTWAQEAMWANSRSGREVGRAMEEAEIQQSEGLGSVHALPPVGCVALDNLLTLSEPQLTNPG